VGLPTNTLVHWGWVSYWLSFVTAWRFVWQLFHVYFVSCWACSCTGVQVPTALASGLGLLLRSVGLEITVTATHGIDRRVMVISYVIRFAS
jgi:hypothetical protein